LVLFKTFFDANTAREFLQNGSNFKDKEKNNFSVRWFNSDDQSLLSEEFQAKISKFSQKLFEEEYLKSHLNTNFNTLQIGNTSNINKMMSQIVNTNYSSDLNLGCNLNNQYLNYNQNNSNNFSENRKSEAGDQNLCSVNFNTSLNNNCSNNKRKNSSSNYKGEEYDEKAKNSCQSGKYTCRFEIQIGNDKEFQVARRLIGAKVK
jgi:hypothetical protein